MSIDPEQSLLIVPAIMLQVLLSYQVELELVKRRCKNVEMLSHKNTPLGNPIN